MVSSQEQSLMTLLTYEDRLSINIRHVGEKSYSSHSISEFNRHSKAVSAVEQRIDAKVEKRAKPAEDPNEDRRVKVVAEITTNHLGILTGSFK